MESWILRVSLQETRSVHDSINIQKIEFITYIYILLAHLSRRLMGELIVYQSLSRPSVRPSVVRSSTFSNIFSSETTGPIKLKFHMETP